MFSLKPENFSNPKLLKERNSENKIRTGVTNSPQIASVHAKRALIVKVTIVTVQAVRVLAPPWKCSNVSLQRKANANSTIV
jgi:hypothetical protein